LGATVKDNKVRIDKWLWAARFFKTRSIATKAVSGGLVHVNGERCKPSREVSPGDELRITRGKEEFVIVVTGLRERRGSATLARALYDETEASLKARETAREQRRLMAAVRGLDPVRRPSKRGRRLIRRFIRGEDE
jgi:ribosome-associated heat shock protein Hsp15